MPSGGLPISISDTDLIYVHIHTHIHTHTDMYITYSNFVSHLNISTRIDQYSLETDLKIMKKKVLTHHYK